jgi:hypothetical protein
VSADPGVFNGLADSRNTLVVIEHQPAVNKLGAERAWVHHHGTVFLSAPPNRGADLKSAILNSPNPSPKSDQICKNQDSTAHNFTPH